MLTWLDETGFEEIWLGEYKSIRDGAHRELGLFGFYPDGFRSWLTRGPSGRSRRDEALGAKVRSSFQDSDRTYGARRLRRAAG